MMDDGWSLIFAPVSLGKSSETTEGMVLAPHVAKPNRNSFLAAKYFCSQELR